MPAEKGTEMRSSSSNLFSENPTQWSFLLSVLGDWTMDMGVF